MSYGDEGGPVSLGGNPWAGDTRRRLILDRNGRVVHNPAYRRPHAASEIERTAAIDKPVRLAELGNARWNGYEPMRAQGRRDGQNVRNVYQDLRRDSSKPVLDRTTSVPLERPSIGMMAKATNDALNTVWGGHGVPGSTSGLNTEFSRMDRLPDFSKGNWKRVYSTHASEAYEHALPGASGMVVKVYLKDHKHEGLDTATITAPTESIDHYGAWPAYKIGLPVNSRNSAMYLSGRHIRKDDKK